MSIFQLRTERGNGSGFGNPSSKRVNRSQQSKYWAVTYDLRSE